MMDICREKEPGIMNRRKRKLWSNVFCMNLRRKTMKPNNSKERC